MNGTEVKTSDFRMVPDKGCTNTFPTPIVYFRTNGDRTDIGSFERDDANPVTISKIVVNDNFTGPWSANQRSRVKDVTIYFSDDVELPYQSAQTTAFQLERQNDNALPSFSVVTVDAKTYRLAIAGSGTAIEHGSLADGNYILTVFAAGVSASYFSGDGDTTAELSPTDNYVLTGSPSSSPTLFRLFGDGDGNGVVDATDESAFLTAFNAGSTTALHFDFDGDGVVDNDDKTAFYIRYPLP